MRVKESRLDDYIGVPIPKAAKRRLTKLAGPKHGAMTDLARDLILAGLDRKESEAKSESQKPVAAAS